MFGLSVKSVKNVKKFTFIRSLFIQTQSTPNENALKFIPSGIKVLPVGNKSTIEINNMKEAISKSELALKLLSVNDRAISSILFGPDFITVVKSSGMWSILKPQIFAILTEHLTMGQSIFKNEFLKKLKEENENENKIDELNENEEISDEEEVILLIKELLTTRIQPAIQEDGGDIQFIRFDNLEGIVYLKLIGACKSCSSSEITLKSGIEDMLKYYIDEVKGVKQVFDEKPVKVEENDVQIEELPPLL
ncbi:hypothetical protein CANINC_003552 [Pichia inconspicua]|uniref:Scaffold protein Nfu/NifU N-terminal domain-containing protein n=1 Tax=Pichia inconspicua TaxID=52247 RepID=A0A4T0WYB2_9ASCO|nr:hypothetical protein CANINC_003552 [[Candida] inconspicua]